MIIQKVHHINFFRKIIESFRKIVRVKLKSKNLIVRLMQIFLRVGAGYFRKTCHQNLYKLPINVYL